ncbi:MAG: hypothetical protein PWQ91_1756 [Eubacteriales bacterium]|nr:hypothetical protein [Eubacteriales bacterium]
MAEIDIESIRKVTKGVELGSLEHMAECVFFTGEVAAETARITARELSSVKG